MEDNLDSVESIESIESIDSKQIRDLDSIYFRIKRDHWMSICFSDLTEEEMRFVLVNYDRKRLLDLAVTLGRTIYRIGEELDVRGVQSED